MIERQSEITCPDCGHRASAVMPLDACIYFYDCQGCGAINDKAGASVVGRAVQFGDEAIHARPTSGSP